MDATLILIDSDAELARARTLVDRLWDSNAPADVARLEAQLASERDALTLTTIARVLGTPRS